MEENRSTERRRATGSYPGLALKQVLRKRIIVSMAVSLEEKSSPGKQISWRPSQRFRIACMEETWIATTEEGWLYYKSSPPGKKRWYRRLERVMVVKSQ